ncbi:acetyltransferase [Xylariaceae sp. FL1272]|nr:acetyltransferase [Xylariaceae sp. FL1272]
MPPTSKISIRLSTEADAQFMMDAFDAALPALAARGSGAQWGSTPFRELPPDQQEKRSKMVRQAMKFQATGEGNPIRIYIAEKEITQEEFDSFKQPVYTRDGEDGKKYLAVAYVRLSEDYLPDYIAALIETQEAVKKELGGKKDYVYLEALIADFRTGEYRKGAGAALIKFAKEYCLEKKKPTLYLDSWAGNEGTLIKYYTGQGFSLFDEFRGPKPDGSEWHGAVYRMDVKEEK